MGFFDKVAGLFKSPKSSVDDRVDPKNNTSLGVRDDTSGLLTGVTADADVNSISYYLSDRSNRVRADLYAQYREMEEQFPEVNSGLDMYADYCVSGGGVDITEGFQVKCDDKGILDAINAIEKRVKIKDIAWSIVRSMCRDGEVFAENVFDVDGLTRLKVLPSRSVTRLEDKFGNLLADKAFVQRVGSLAIDFKPWQMSHYRLMVDPQEIYGRSILYPLRRLCKELSLAEDALTIARLTRAHQRFKWVVDVTGMNPASARQYIQDFKRDVRKRRIVDPSTGRLSQNVSPLRAEEDIFVPRNKDGVGDVQPMQGDSSMTNIRDVEHKYERLFTGFKISKAWFGLTGPNIRSVMGEQGLNFMRTVRRVRKDFMTPTVRAYMIGLLVEGVPIEKVLDADITLTFPMMSHADDELRYRLLTLQLAVGKAFGDQRLMGRADILRYVFKFEEADVKKYIAGAESDPNAVTGGGVGGEAPPQSAQGKLVGTANSLTAAEFQDRMDQLLEQYPEMLELVGEIRELMGIVRESHVSEMRRAG